MKRFIDQRVTLNALATFVSKGLNILIALISTITVIFYFTELQQGLFYFILSILSFALAAESGLTLSTAVNITNGLKGITKSSLIDCNRQIQKDSNIRAVVGFSLIAFLAVFLLITGLLIVIAIQSGDLSDELDYYIFFFLGVIVLITYFNLLSQSIYEGCGELHRFQKRMVVANICGLLIFIVSVSMELYTLAILNQYFIRALILSVLLNKDIKLLQILFRPWNFTSIKRHGMKISGFQIKIAISWICGAAMYYSIVPIVGLSGDLETAGYIGICLQLFHGVLGLSLSWQLGGQAAFVNYLRSGSKEQFQNFLNRISINGVKTGATVMFIVLLFIKLLDIFFPIIERFGSFSDALIFCVTAVVLVGASTKTAAVRANREDPFLYLSIVVAILVVLMSIIASGYNLTHYIPEVFFVIMVSQAIMINKIFDTWIERLFSQR